MPQASIWLCKALLPTSISNYMIFLGVWQLSISLAIFLKIRLFLVNQHVPGAVLSFLDKIHVYSHFILVYLRHVLLSLFFHKETDSVLLLHYTTSQYIRIYLNSGSQNDQNINRPFRHFFRVYKIKTLKWFRTHYSKVWYLHIPNTFNWKNVRKQQKQEVMLASPFTSPLK